MSVLMETILGRLGSRFCLSFRPREKQVWASPLGRLFDRPLGLEISLPAGETRMVWPFSSGEQIGLFEQHLTMTTLSFRCVSDELGIELSIKFTSPFYPQNEKVSGAPFFYVDLTCRPVPSSQLRPMGEVKVSLSARDDEIIIRENAGVVVRGIHRLSNEAPIEDADEFSRGEFAGSIALIPIRGKMNLKESTFSIPYSTDEGAETRATFILAAYSAETVLRMDEAPHRFKYVGWFPSLSSVVEFARHDEQDNRELSQIFDDLFLRCSLGQSEKNLIAYSFQSHLSATWWTEPVSGGEPDWFGCWDKRAFHNSLESEPVYALLYLNLWPDLLEKQLCQRAFLENRIGFFPVHSGRFLLVRPPRGQAAGVELVSEYLLTFFAYWRWWNRIEPIQSNAALIRKLGNDVLRSDAAQVGRAHAQTRQALKALFALDAVALMAVEFNDGDLSEACNRAVASMKEDFRERAWLGDHFSLSLDGETSGFEESGGKGLSEKKTSYSISTSNGVLYHLMCDYFPSMDISLFAQDILSSASKTLSCRDSLPATDASGSFSIWLNVWRDIVAAYFGIDFIQMAQRYWSFQTFANVQGWGGGYADSLDSQRHASDPRGAVTIGLCQALLGLKLDRVEGGLFVSPLSVPAEGPLLPLADWPNRRVPWVSVKCDGSRMTAQVDSRDLVESVGEFAVDPHPELKWGGA